MGYVPGLSLVYVQLNRLINERDANVIYLAGPGHGGPALVGHAYLEGTYSEVYPDVTQDVAGLRHLCRRFSTPGGIPSHVSVQTPGSIHEGGELGYVLSHAFGAAFDNPDLIVAAVVGDGEAESGPLAGAWRGTAFLNPARDGAVLPILHLNGYKISGPTVLGRDSDDDLRAFLQGNGYEAHFVEGDDPPRVHQAFAATLDRCYDRIRGIQREARERGVAGGRAGRPSSCAPRRAGPARRRSTVGQRRAPSARTRCRWRTSAPTRHTWRSWKRGCARYKPETLFDADGKLIPELAALAPQGDRRMSANPHANGGTLLVDLDIPDFRDYAVDVDAARRSCSRSPPVSSASCCATCTSATPGRRTSACSARTRRTPTGSATSSRSRTAASSAARWISTTTWRRTAASWRCSASTSARAGWRATR